MSIPTVPPDQHSPAPHRPAGVTLSAVVLALLACLGLLTGATTIFSALAVRNLNTIHAPGIAPVQISLGGVFLFISSLCVVVVVGLFRIKRWARVSILILGGLLACLSILSTIFLLVFAFSSAFARVASQAQGVSPLAMRIAFLAMGAFYLIGALIGIWWVIYFNRRRVRELFAADGAPATSEEPLSLPGTAVAPARGLVEILLACLAVLYFFGALCAAVTASFQFPLLFAGFIFRGISASVLSVAIGAVNLALGIGILRRSGLAWKGALAYNAVALFSILVLVLPGRQSVLASYRQEIMPGTIALNLPNADPLDSYVQVISALGGALFVCAIFWLLRRARPLFRLRRKA